MKQRRTRSQAQKDRIDANPINADRSNITITPSPRKVGMPTKYTQAIADEICRRLAEGETLGRICKSEHMVDRSTVWNWIYDPIHADFAKAYDLARERQRRTWADELTDISDDATNDYMEGERGNEIVNSEHISRSKLRIDTRKWLLSKLEVKTYGDKVALTDPDGGKLTINIVKGLADV